MFSAPKAMIIMRGGLAMLRVLQGAVTTAFKGPFAFGAMVSFLVTVADLPLFGIGAAFWGLVSGAACSWLVERRDFRERSPRIGAHWIDVSDQCRARRHTSRV
jgi:benzoate membrane transport protein